MSKWNVAKLVEKLYEANPDAENDEICDAIEALVGRTITYKYLSVYKARLRASGIRIPDKRRKEKRDV